MLLILQPRKKISGRNPRLVSRKERKGIWGKEFLPACSSRRRRGWSGSVPGYKFNGLKREQADNIFHSSFIRGRLYRELGRASLGRD